MWVFFFNSKDLWFSLRHHRVNNRRTFIGDARLPRFGNSRHNSLTFLIDLQGKFNIIFFHVNTHFVLNIIKTHRL